MNILKLLSLIALTLLNVNGYSQTKPWVRYSDGLPTEGVLSLTNIGNVIFAGTDKGGIFKSEDAALNWIALPAHNTLKNSASWSLASIDTFLFAAQRGGGILKISLNGTAWELKNSGLKHKILQDIIAVDTTLYVATYGGGVYYSTNLADTWQVLDNNAGMDDSKVYALAHNAEYIYAGTAGINSLPDTGVAYWKLFSGGDWNRVNNGFIRNGAHLDSVFSMDANDSLVYAGTDDVGLYRTDDNGANWKQVDSYTGDIHAIKMAGKNVYYGTSYAGVHSSFDNGHTWSTNNTGLSYGNVTLPYLVKDFLVMDTVIYAATDIGVFRQRLPEIITSAKEEKDFYPTVLVYPNPFSSELNIKLEDLIEGNYELSILNNLGQQVYSKDINCTSGENNFSYKATSLNPGTYIIRIKSGQILINKTVVKI